MQPAPEQRIEWERKKGFKNIVDRQTRTPKKAHTKTIVVDKEGGEILALIAHSLLFTRRGLEFNC